MVVCMAIYLFAQCCSNLETDHTEDGELHAVLQTVCHQIPNWHYLSVDTTLPKRSPNMINQGTSFITTVKPKDLPECWGVRFQVIYLPGCNVDLKVIKEEQLCSRRVQREGRPHAVRQPENCSKHRRG